MTLTHTCTLSPPTGVINPSTREWKDGLFSVIMRDLANASHDGPKWIVLDGDIDPMWIESLNTVMDDNKVRHICPIFSCELCRNKRLYASIEICVAGADVSIE